MSAEAPDCARCRLYRGEVAMLHEEIAGLKRALLNLTRPATGDAPCLEITGMKQLERFMLAGPFGAGADRSYRASLAHRDCLTVNCDVPGIDPAEFRTFFQDLAQH